MGRRILLINGPNLNLLGTREPAIYGNTSLGDIETAARAQASTLGIELELFQSNHEGAIVDRIQAAAGLGPLAAGRGTDSPNSPSHPQLHAESNHAGIGGSEGPGGRKVSAIIINPGGLTHTSVVVRDALLGVDIPFVELHVSNIHAREPWRHHSYFHDKATAIVCGMGAYGYTAAIEFAARHLKVKEE
jgi:3-dehydroquinate dehydratase-2